MEPSARVREVPDVDSLAAPAEQTRGRGVVMGATSIRVLVIDDDPSDAFLIVAELQRSGYAVTSDRVQTAPALEAALRQQWDVITCDWVMPAFSAREALTILGAHEVDAPVIIVSGQAAEQVTVTAMKAGAHDVISKHNLTRLGPAVERELHDAGERRRLRRAEMALKASEARYRRLFETAKDGIFILEAATGQIIDVNPFLEHLLGYRRDDLMGKQLWELGPFKDIAANRDAFHDLQMKEYIRYEHLPLESRGGGRTDVEFISNAYDCDGERVVHCNVRDITERKRADRQIRALNAELERRVRERTAAADEINAQLESFSYSVSHDLRAPLRHIEGFSKALLQGHAAQLDDRGRECVDRILTSTRRMGELITDLLSLSTITRMEMVRQTVDLSALCATIVADLRKSDPDRSVEFVLDPAVVAEGDPRLLRVALENLLGNAWKYTSQHPAARIEFGACEREGRVVFFVRDDGAGFDMAHAGKLFGAFQRMHGVAEFEGTGIGLATVQRVVRRHGGEVWAEAAVERGTTISFTLGSAEPAPELAQPPA